jgi:ABC-2 type transport system ATP-binding protein
VIHTEQLTRKFGDLVAVDRLDLDVPQGEVLGFLGPNGAGKTTTVRMLAALIAPTSGRAVIAGKDVAREPDAVRHQVGLLTETPGLYDRLSAGKNLAIFASLHGVPDVAVRVEKYLRWFDLWERRDDPAGSFSKGMRQKLALARAMLHEPPILFLDEPTSGLDPEAALLVRDAVHTLKGEGRTIFLTTHNLDEAERLCDRVAVFRSRLLVIETPAHLRDQMFGHEVAFHLREATDAHLEAVRPLVSEAVRDGTKILVRVDDPAVANPGIVRALVGAGADIQFVGEVRRSLEEVYLHLVKEAS